MIVMQSLHAVTHCAVFQVTYPTSKVGVKTKPLGDELRTGAHPDELLKLSSRIISIKYNTRLLIKLYKLAVRCTVIIHLVACCALYYGGLAGIIPRDHPILTTWVPLH